MQTHQIEISVKGKWITIPALHVEGHDLIVRGKWLRMASVEAEEWVEHEVENPHACVHGLKQAPSNLKADIFTFTQKPPRAEARFHYHHEPESVAVVKTGDFKAWWEGLPQESRKNVRRAQKRGVTIRVQEIDDALIHQLVALNNDSAVRQGKAYTHFGKSPEQVKKDQESFPESRQIICAYHEDELVGFMKIIHRGEVTSILQLLGKASHNDKRPANALMAKAVECCAERGTKWMVFGLFNYGNKKGDPLREFKERNGFEEMLIPRYYVPLTIKGSICLKLGLHRGAVGILPPWAIKMVVAGRTSLYNLKSFISRCSLTAERPNRNRQTERSTPPAGSNPQDLPDSTS